MKKPDKQKWEPWDRPKERQDTAWKYRQAYIDRVGRPSPDH